MHYCVYAPRIISTERYTVLYYYYYTLQPLQQQHHQQKIEFLWETGDLQKYHSNHPAISEPFTIIHLNVIIVQFIFINLKYKPFDFKLPFKLRVPIL